MIHIDQYYIFHNLYIMIPHHIPIRDSRPQSHKTQSKSQKSRSVVSRQSQKLSNNIYVHHTGAVSSHKSHKIRSNKAVAGWDSKGGRLIGQGKQKLKQMSQVGRQIIVKKQENIMENHVRNRELEEVEAAFEQAQFVRSSNRRERLTNFLQTNNNNCPKTAQQKQQQRHFDQIATEVHLNCLQSKIVKPSIIKNQKGREINQIALVTSGYMQDEIIRSQNVKQDSASQAYSFTQQINVNKLVNNESILNMDAQEEKKIDQSVKGRIRRLSGQSVKSNSKKSQTKVRPNIQQSGVNVILKQPQNRFKLSKTVQFQPNSIKFASKKTTNLSLNTCILGQSFQNNITGQQLVIMEETQDLQKQIKVLKNTVRTLRLQKVKAKAQQKYYQDMNSLQIVSQSQQKSKLGKNVYDQTINSKATYQHDRQTYQQTISKPGSIHFGRIRKNITSKRHNQINTQDKTSYNTPNSLINVDSFYLNHINSFNSNQLNVSKHTIPQESLEQYKTLDFSSIQNLKKEVISDIKFGSSVPQNKITLRGRNICTKIMQKFDNDDSKFKKFINRQLHKSKVARQLSNPQTKINNPEHSKQSLQLDRQNIQGIIMRNKANTSLKDFVAKLDSRIQSFIDPTKMKLIQQQQKIQLTKKKRHFSQNCIPQFSDAPSASTPTTQIVDMILPLLDIFGLQYEQQDLQSCILKKYKNCVMFELPTHSQMKVVWHFTGKLYIGGWDQQLSHKEGFGIQYIREQYYYRGQFRQNKKEGKGIMIYADESIYEGQWSDNLKEGKGNYYDSDQQSYYEGSWKNDKMQGWGHYQIDGSIFQGNFQLNHKQGFGTQIFQNGDRYIGYYIENEITGQGKYVWYNKSTYVGQFVNGYREGIGKWQSGQQNKQIYMGQFVKDRKEGSGRYIWSNRCVHEGNFFNDLKHGYGSMSYPDGRIIEGIWTQGIITDVLGKIQQANKQDPLNEPKHRTIVARTSLRVIDKK